MVIQGLELFSAAVGSVILWRVTVTQRFSRFATGVFLMCYVPLFCMYPVIGRWLAGGAQSISPRINDILIDPKVYFIYQAYNFLILAGCLLLAVISPVPHRRSRKTPALLSLRTYGLLLGLFLGVFLYVYSTGLSIVDLLIASRFEWFISDQYSPFLSVLGSYFVSLTPALVYLAAKDDRKKLLAVTLLLLIGYGALSKDRKWLIFIASGLLAASYIRMKFQVRFSGKGVFWLILFALALAFWQVARGLIFESIVSGGVDLATEIPLMLEKLLTKGDLPYYYNSSMTAIHMNLNEGYSIPFGLLRRQLFFFLPADFSFGLKIEDISAIFSDAIDGGDEVRRGNMPPGLIGLFVLSFEWYCGWIILIGLPFALRAMDNLIVRTSGVVQISLVSNMLSAMLLLLRGDDSSATYFVVFTIIVLTFLGILVRVYKSLVPHYPSALRIS